MPPTSTTLRLDTAAPADVEATINGGNAETANVDVSLAVSTSDTPTDGYQVKVWGAIDPTYPGNATYGETEGGAMWLTLSSPFSVRLLPGAGAKSLFVRMRDDVWNESDVVSDSITLTGLEAAEPTLPPPGVPLGPTVEPTRKVRVRSRCVARDRVRTRSARATRIMVRTDGRSRLAARSRQNLTMAMELATVVKASVATRDRLEIKDSVASPRFGVPAEDDADAMIALDLL